MRLSVNRGHSLQEGEIEGIHCKEEREREKGKERKKGLLFLRHR